MKGHRLAPVPFYYYYYYYYLMLGATQILLKGDAALIDLLRHLAAYIAVMPRLIDDAGDAGGAVGIAENEAVRQLLAMSHCWVGTFS